MEIHSHHEMLQKLIHPNCAFDLTVTSMPHHRKVFIVRRDGPGRSPLVVEPLTLGWVAITLAEGLLAAAGAQIFANLTGANVNVAALQTDALNKVQQIVQQAIQDDAIRDCGARMDDVMTQMKNYSVDPRDALLDDAESKISYVVSALKSFGFKVEMAFTTAAGIYMSILQERWLKCRESGDPGCNPGGKKTALRSLVIGSLRTQGQMFTDMISWSNARFTELRPDRRAGWYFEYSGLIISGHPARIFTGTSDRNEAEKQRQDYMNHECSALYRQLGDASWDVRIDWLDLRTELADA